MSARATSRKGAGRGAGTLLLTAFAALAVAAPATADRGVSIDLGRVAVEQKLSPGGAYRLPTIGVRNPGDERTTYRLTVSGLSSGGRTPPAEWIRFDPERLSLDPMESRPVTVRLIVPTDADPGEYAALVGPEIAAEANDVSVGAAAAARLTFTVEPSSVLAAWWLWIKTWLSDGAPWSYVVPALLALGLATRALRRRFALSVVRRA